MPDISGKPLQIDSIPEESTQVKLAYSRALWALGFWCLLQIFRYVELGINPWLTAIIDLLVGLVLIQVSCQIIITATDKLANIFNWDHFVAGTWSEILASLPEAVVVAFLVSVNPYLAFITVMLTIYINALVFSGYSFFLPKDYRGKFLMPKPITEAGTQILVAGGVLGLILGSTIISLRTTKVEIIGFSNADLISIATLLLILFITYLYRLTVYYANEDELLNRKNGNAQYPRFKIPKIKIKSSLKNNHWLEIASLFLVSIIGSVLGGACVHDFAHIMTDQLEVDAFIAAFLLAAFSGMSEYVILWNAHRDKKYGIALANAFGGMTQVLFLILPITFIFGAIASLFNTEIDDYWLIFTTTSILLFIFLFPTFYTLTALLEEDHTFDLLDTSVMVSIVLILLYLLMSYGNGVH